MARKSACEAAADRLEELVPHIKEIILALRAADQDTPWGDPYAQVYELRYEISRVVRSLGAGSPGPSSHEWE